MATAKLSLPTPLPSSTSTATALSPAEALNPLVHSIFTTSTISFFLNGEQQTLHNIDPSATLLEYIRSHRGLKGTKLGCGEGGCGACTVVVQQADSRGRVECRAINACLAPIVSVDGKHLLTIEALGTVDAPHPLQQRIAALHASQCGFCTPGIIMSLYALLRNAYDPHRKVFRLARRMVEVEGALDGNLCRCTGYKPIFEVARSFVTEDLGGVLMDEGEEEGVEEGEGAEGLGGNWTVDAGKAKGVSCGRPGGCCRDSPSSSESGQYESSDGETASASTNSSTPPPAEEEQKSNGQSTQPGFKEYSPGSEIIFPFSLRKYEFKPLCFGNERKVWFRPVTLEQVLMIKDAFPSAKLVGGSSEVQVEVKFKNSEYAVCVYVGDVPELKGFAVDEAKGEAVIGGNEILSLVEGECLKWGKKLGPRGLGLEAIRKQLRYFAGRQIRNASTTAGNIATASPISDLNPVFVCAGARLIAHSLSKGPQELDMRKFFLAYRTTALPADAVITKIIVPLGHASGREIIKAYKQAKRKDDDIAIVTAGLRVRLGEDGCVEDVCLAYGGMAPTTVEARNTQEVLMGKKWFEPAVLEEAMGAMEKDFNLSYSVPGGMPTYRKTVAFSFLFRFWHEVAAELKIAEVDRSLVSGLDRHVFLSGTRDHDNPYEQEVVGKQIPHVSGLKQATGQAEFIDDMPKMDAEVFGAFVMSSKAHAKLIEVDFSPALESPGVVGFVDHHDLSEDRMLWGTVVKDERFFAKDIVRCHGDIIGMVLAESAAQAQTAAKLVRIVYEELPAIISIDEAIAAGSYFESYKSMLKTGKPIEEALAKCDHVISGVSKMGGQEHFYLETNAALAIPKEHGEMEVWSSTQNTMETQEMVSQVTGIPANRIVVRVKRLGGGFGGKEARCMPISCILAVAAKKLGRPCRGMLNRDEDMLTTGQRHPFQAHWRVGFSKDGMLQALDADVYDNAGHSLDLSGAVMDRCLTHIENAYWIPNVHVRGHVCRTNTHSNTAFRGFGGPQGNYIAECIMTTIADKLGIDVDALRFRNLYKEGQKTPFLQTLVDWHVPEMMEELQEACALDERKKEVAEYNSANKYKKRGISMVPTKFGISFATACHLNQAGALIHIYTDGSVLLAHGGNEMGQGLWTKMIAVAAQELQVPFESVFTADSSSNTVANASPTAASSGSDLNGMAIKHACDQLNGRLIPYRKKYGNDMKAIASAAFVDRVNLSANGFYKMPDVGYKWGNHIDPLPLYFYFTQGVACTEVELDVLTGDHFVRRTDIIMDVGRSINPAIDYGQIEGAFVQGMGLFTTEETLWTARDGKLFTTGPGTYKIPGFADIPKEFNVRLLKKPKSQWKNLRSIQSSKGIGEPPLFLGATVLFALREAVKAAREEVGGKMQETLVLDSPATCERIRGAIGGDVWERMRVKKEGRPFFVCAQGETLGLAL
ncbi:molybdopterin binding aldehyde oxidase/xanthine dehydrogenase [Tricharina praecox]|uniref:molybdopterin binding aldehyde oxidase/xanthine dehydrogenase n=1 Tax=Tricharina praecox TaxID=43433 RepID=UPI00221EF261|nr:molybdopterin binding aldehyde oxidase/xanthine dehydrogenase [Tricharina praecox]KAI5857796.1 molybdopterin binding aldehyde oxidase/xanthine dehydrogenase [Tricharina praecox]